MQPNGIKKGTRIMLQSGWGGTMYDNKKGNIRLVEVDGPFKEVGSVYADEITHAEVDGEMVKLDYPPAMLKARDARRKAGF